MLITAKPTALVPDPPPGLIERVTAVQAEQIHVAEELRDHRDEVTRKLEQDHHNVTALLEQHCASDAESFDAIQKSLGRLETNGHGNGR